MLGLAIFITWRIRTSHKKDDETLVSFSAYKPINAEPSQSAVMTLQVRTLRLWLLVWRASSESFLHNREIPKGKEILTRRVIIDKLKELNLFDGLTDKERDLHLLPDGTWSTEDIATNLFRRSELEALQYAAGVVSALVPIEDFNRIQNLDIDQIKNITSDALWKTQETFELRNERDMAAAFYFRCLGEKVRRGTFETNLDQQERELLEGVAERAGDENADLLIGTQIVSDVDDTELNLAVGQSYLRFTTLQQALSLLEPTDQQTSIANPSPPA